MQKYQTKKKSNGIKTGWIGKKLGYKFNNTNTNFTNQVFVEIKSLQSQVLLEVYQKNYQLCTIYKAQMLVPSGKEPSPQSIPNQFRWNHSMQIMEIQVVHYQGSILLGLKSKALVCTSRS
eukprot:EC096447.1.p3 GENE.EC096447.1~~EC096447.1.p3  ORF type:complete len:120 (+),score=1.08 EC096447.1:240-599(+)